MRGVGMVEIGPNLLGVLEAIGFMLTLGIVIYFFS